MVKSPNFFSIHANPVVAYLNLNSVFAEKGGYHLNLPLKEYTRGRLVQLPLPFVGEVWVWAVFHLTGGASFSKSVFDSILEEIYNNLANFGRIVNDF